jgi:hypothetical protein
MEGYAPAVSVASTRDNHLMRSWRGIVASHRSAKAGPGRCWHNSEALTDLLSGRTAHNHCELGRLLGNGHRANDLFPYMAADRFSSC